MILFEDRIDAANQLARTVQEWLEDNKNKYTTNNNNADSAHDDIIVLALPREGVVIGDFISDILGAKLDIVVSRKIGAPDNPEFAIGAVMPDGSYFLNEDIVDMLNIPQSYITQQANIQKKEIQRRVQIFTGKSSKGDEVEGEAEKQNRGYYNSYYNNNNNFEGKIVVLVDDGIATGATMLSAAQWLKTKQNCCKILIIAVPVAPPPPSPSLQTSSNSNEDTVRKLNQIADKVIILYRPEPFYSVGQFYKQFEQVTDMEVRQ